MRRQGIREITLRSGMGPEHAGNSYSVTFRRHGTAEMVNGTVRSSDDEAAPRPAPGTNNETQQNAGTHKRTTFSTDRFESLAATLDNNGFFSKDESGAAVTDASQSLTVLTTTGEKTIQTLGRNDPQIKSMLDAIGKLTDELQWEQVE
jgi:hypothetical protein